MLLSCFRFRLRSSLFDPLQPAFQRRDSAAQVKSAFEHVGKSSLNTPLVAFLLNANLLLNPLQNLLFLLCLLLSSLLFLNLLLRL